MKTKYFGALRAEIDTVDRRIELSFLPRAKFGQLDAKYPQRCLSWAITALKPYIDKGYYLVGPEAAPGG